MTLSLEPKNVENIWYTEKALQVRDFLKFHPYLEMDIIVSIGVVINE